MVAVNSAHLQEQMCALNLLLTAVKKILVMIVQLLVMKKVRSMTGMIVPMYTVEKMIPCFMKQAAAMQDSLPVMEVDVIPVVIKYLLLMVTVQVVVISGL